MNLTKQQVDAGELEQYNPDRFDATWHEDGSCTLIPLLWWDNESYANYQSQE